MNVYRLIFCVIGSLALHLNSGWAKPDEDVQAPEQSLVIVDESDFGTAYAYEDVRTSVGLKNTSDKAVTIREVRPRLQTEKFLGVTPIRIAPNARIDLDVSIQTGSGIGRIAKYFDIFADSKEAPIASFAARGFVDWDVDPESVSIDFGNIDLGNGVARTIEIKKQPGSLLVLDKVLHESTRFDMEIIDGGERIRLISKKDAPLGLFDDHLLISTLKSRQKKIGVRVRGQFVTRLVPSSNPVDFGLLRVGDTSEQIVRLSEIDGKPVKIGSIRTEGAAVKATLQDCIPKSDSCRNLRLQLPEQEVRGQVGGIIYLELLPSKREFPLNFGMVVIGKGTQIRSMDDDLKTAAETQAPVSDVLKNAIRKPVAPLEMPRPPGNEPLLTWQAANEYGVFGYEIYRGRSKSGPFERVTREFIRRLDASGQVGSVYRWRDTSAKAGTTYFYYVGLVYEDGRKSEFTTPQEIVAK